MKIEDIVARFDDRPGFRLVDFGEIGLPVYKLTATALMLTRKSLSPIEEFILRTIHMGFSQVSEVSALLGLGETTVCSSLANLIRSEDVIEQPDNSISLTLKGSRTVANEASVTPREQTIIFFYDGLTREPRWFGDQALFTPKQAEAAGLRQIRAFPARKPRADELDVNDVFETLKKALRASEEHQQLLRIKEVRFAHRLYIKGIMLVYKSETTDDVQVGFTIDGRRSEHHELAFLKANGPKKLGIVDAVRQTNSEKEQDDALGNENSKRIRENTKSADQHTSTLQREMASAKFVVEIAEQKLEVASGELEVEKARKDLNKVRNRVGYYEEKLQEVQVRPVPVYEHPKFLETSLKDVKTRLLIISPWITPAVVDRKMIQSLRELLVRGVNVYIGYGISREVSGRDNNSAVEELQKLSVNYKNFIFIRMGDTHAKVLIEDSKYYIITSFNWLSFRGDPKRTFREEWGTYVGIKEQVNQYFDELLPRFNE